MCPANYPSRSRNGKIELRILNQPEEQHRARYLTEGSRGSIKDGTGLGHPVVKLFGFNGCPVKLQCFIGHDKYIGVPHLFYQASRITGKNSTRCSFSKVDGTSIISLDLTPDNNMQATVDCIGILKERNVDVEQKVLKLKAANGVDHNGIAMPVPSKKRCAKCRLVFRCRIPGTGEVLQAVSTPILCTQPVGTPEICKISTTECEVAGGQELYIIGKNFLKDSKVFFKCDNWGKVIEPDKEYLHSSHLICTIPPYDGPNAELPGYFTVSISIRSGGKYSDSHVFTYVNESKANTMLPLSHSSDNSMNLHHNQQQQHRHPHHQTRAQHQQLPLQPLSQVQPQTQQQQPQHGLLGNGTGPVGNHYGNLLADQQTTFMQPLAAGGAGGIPHGEATIIDGIKREEGSTLCHLTSRVHSSETLLSPPSMPMETARYYSEDTLHSSDSSTISETILASEDSCFSNHSTLTSPLSTNHAPAQGPPPPTTPTTTQNVDLSVNNFIGRLSEPSPLLNSSPERVNTSYGGDQPTSALTFNPVEPVLVNSLNVGVLAVGNGNTTQFLAENGDNSTFNPLPAPTPVGQSVGQPMIKVEWPCMDQYLNMPSHDLI